MASPPNLSNKEQSETGRRVRTKQKHALQFNREQYNKKDKNDEKI